MQMLNREMENKWRKYWQQNKTYKVSIDPSKPKFYVLDMFPYPSGAGLHVGHPLGYIASDIYSRFKRMKGFNVLHPMGYDAFGLPAEQYAIETGVHPADSTQKNIKRYREQLDNIGFSFDWDREVKTSNPQYYKWTQWIFTLLFDHYYDVEKDTAVHIDTLISIFDEKGNIDTTAFTSTESQFTAENWKGYTPQQKDEVLMHYRLAYRQKTFVNWCEVLGTVLANDEVKDGLSERGGHPVEKRPMLQWSLRITAYAERLLSGLKNVQWSDSITAMQENWIGKSEGAQLHFGIKGHEETIEIFTTRPDTIYGATFMVLAPEHDLVNKISTNTDAVTEYKEYVGTRSERDRMADVKTVTGAFTGAYAIHPLTKDEIPIHISEYVLKDYGTGAIMAVPSDDDRDRRFAEKFDIPIIPVVDKSEHPQADTHDKVGTMINSDFLNGLPVKKAIKKMIHHIETEGLGTRKVNYKLRDANFSRQRYWGEPFPVIYKEDGTTEVMSLNELPLELPQLDNIKPGSGGKSPLAKATDWVKTPQGLRETDTMPGFAGSSWYYFRYMDPTNKEAFAGKEALDYWKEVDLYVGGTEHAVGHLMYSRFWCKFLFDLGYSPVQEPFKKLINQGMIQGVIETLFLKKTKTDGRHHFMCSGLVKKAGDLDNYIPVFVNIDFVNDYGQKNSYLNVDGIEKFIDWRVDYKDAIFECSKGIYKDGKFTSKNNETDSYLITESEVGKMSKSRYNVINPDDVVEEYGADVFRMYEMFLGPIEASKPWDTNGIDGVAKFLKRYVGLYHDNDEKWLVSNEPPTKDELKVLHQTIQKIEHGIERFAFNTCVSALMIAVNDLRKMNCNKTSILEVLNRLLAPFAPFTSEEIHEKLGGTGSIHHQAFPQYQEELTKESEVTYPISINGKKRGEVNIDANMPKDAIEALIKDHEVVQKWSEGKQVRRIIVVPGRMVNVVVG